MDQYTGDLDALLDDAEAASELEVQPDRIQVMVDQGLLTPVGDTDAEGGRRFRRADVLALRELGG
ncbi:MAG TPA: MerR family transcriptional regulator [Acidimicrobiales bacterium]|nr:MerR family transcriptional regulator [Acidimicrobiales bacterium]